MASRGLNNHDYENGIQGLLIMPANHYQYTRPAPVLPPADSLLYPANLIVGCSECGLRNGCTRPVPSENCAPCNILFVGQNPGCFPSGTLISTLSGVQDIADISVGNDVLGRDGKARRVTAVFSRDSTEMTQLKVHKMDGVALTPNHPVLTVRLKQCYNNHSRRYCSPDCYRQNCALRPDWKNIVPKWIPAQSLVAEQDFVIVPELPKLVTSNAVSLRSAGIQRIPFPQRTKFRQTKYKSTRDNVWSTRKGFRLGRGLAYVLGWYMAEGCANVRNGTVQFSLGSTDANRMHILQGQCEKAFRITGKWRKQGKVLNYHLYSRPLAAWFIDIFGNGASDKHVPSQIFCSDYRVIQSFIVGWYRGDGKHKKSERNDGIVTASKVAAYGLRDLLLRIGVVPTLHKETWKGFAGDSSFSGSGYCIEFPPEFAWLRNNQSMTHSPYGWLLRVDSVLTATLDSAVRVYNIETEGNEYLVPFIVHNSNEDREGRPFCGQSGQYLDSLLFQCGVPRDSVCISNVVHCLTPNNRELRPDEIQACSHWLELELSIVQPHIVVALGKPATDWFLPGNGNTMEHLHGKPVEKDGRIILPCYHPAFALRDTSKMRQVSEDFQVLRGLVKGRDWREYHVVDEYPNPVYRVVDTPEKVLGMNIAIEQAGEFAVDTEICRGKLWSVQISCKEGEAYFIPIKDNYEGRVDLSHLKATAVVHNYLFDIQYLKLDETNFVDTMTQAYLLGEPQGLKELANRLCGIRMIDYREMVKPGQQRLSLEYLLRASGMEWPDPPAIEETKWDNKKGCLITKSKKPWHISRKINKMLDDYGTNNDTDLWDRWQNIPNEERVVVEGVLGAMPESSLADIPFEDAVHYACLSGNSKVLMADGMYSDIRDLVNNRSRGQVMSLHPKYGIVPRNITGWYKIHCRDRVDWWSVETEEGRFNGRWKNSGTRYTGDHRLHVAPSMDSITVSSDWKKVEDLIPGIDRIALPFMELSWLQHQIVLGSVLGDGCLGRRNKGGWSNLRLSHSKEQEEYLRWKIHLLGNLVQQADKAVVEQWSRQPNKEAKSPHWRVDGETTYHPSLEQLYKKVHISGAKSISDWIEELDSMGLAIFYLDDGTLVNGVSPRLYACDFDADSVDKLISFLHKKWSIRASKTLMSGRIDQYQVHILAPYDKFWSVVSPWVIPSMQYKIPDKWRGQFTGELVGWQYNSRGPVYSTVVRVYRNPHSIGRRGSLRTKWCIDVDETHNFLTMGEIAHNCRDSDATLRVYHKLQKMIADLDLDLVLDMDLNILPMVDSMMRNGMAVDLDHFRKLSEDYDVRMRVMSEEMAGRAGHPFNPNSSDQVAEVIYKELGFKPTKTTPTGKVSTDDAELKKTGHPIAKSIIRYRGIQKLKSTYADSLLEWARLDGQGIPRVHTTIKTTRVETGRLASADPNLQNIPTRNKESKAIKNGFIAPPGKRMVEADYSQVEMVTLAHLSNCKRLVELFNRGGDPHTEMAAEVFGLPKPRYEDGVVDIASESKYRYPVKRLNFGIAYLIGGHGLSTQLQEYVADLEMEGEPVDIEPWDELTCEKFIADWYRLNPEVKDFQLERAAEARRRGYVRDPLSGRIRYIPEINCPIHAVAEGGARMAANFPVTCSAQTIIKTAMGQLWQELPKTPWENDARFLMQVHDSLVVEVTDDDSVAFPFFAWMLQVMTGVFKLRVPIKADLKAGYRWGELKKVRLVG